MVEQFVYKDCVQTLPTLFLLCYFTLWTIMQIIFSARYRDSHPQYSVDASVEGWR